MKLMKVKERENGQCFEFLTTNLNFTRVLSPHILYIKIKIFLPLKIHNQARLICHHRSGYGFLRLHLFHF